MYGNDHQQVSHDTRPFKKKRLQKKEKGNNTLQRRVSQSEHSFYDHDDMVIDDICIKLP